MALESRKGLGVQFKITCRPFSETACALPCGHVVCSVACQKERKERRSEGEVRHVDMTGPVPEVSAVHLAYAN